MFETELGYFMANQESLVSRYSGKVLLIRGNSVADVFDTALEAYVSAQDRFEAGTYMIQPCAPGPAAYSVTIASSKLVHG